jgi:hypothetical protein
MNKEIMDNIIWRNEIAAWTSFLFENKFLVLNANLILDYNTGSPCEIDIGNAEIQSISNGNVYTRTWLHEKKRTDALNPPSLIQCRKLPRGELLWEIEIKDANTIVLEDELLVLHASGSLCRYSHKDGSLMDQLNLEMAKEEWVSYLRVGNNLFLCSPKRTLGSLWGGDKWLICICLEEFTLKWTVHLPTYASGKICNQYGWYSGGWGMITDASERIVIGAGSKLLGLDSNTGKARRKAFNLGGTSAALRKCYSDGTIIVGSRSRLYGPDLKCLDDNGNVMWDVQLWIQEDEITAWSIDFYKDFILAPFNSINTIKIIDRKDGSLVRDIDVTELGIGKLKEIKVFNNEQVLLSGSSGSILYNGIPATWFTLSEEEAESLVNKNPCLSLRWVTTLSETVGGVLAKHKGGLMLNGLTNLSDAAAESLGKHKSLLWLHGLTNLSDAAAESLARHEGELYLGGLTSLSDAAAESLGKHKSTLCINGLTNLSDAAAESLARHEGGLFLDGLTSLSDAAAESLGKHKSSLWLNGLTNLSDAAAESLGKHKSSLELNGLTNLSDAAAESLAKHEGELILGGLTNLSDAAAKGLAKHEGSLISLGLTSLSDTAAKALAEHAGDIDLPRLKSLNDSSECLALAAKLATSDGGLYLDGLTSIAGVAAEALTQHEGDLYISLNGLTSLSDAVAKALSKNKGGLSLDGLTSLSETAAKALAKNKGSLSLCGLKSLSETAARELARRKDGLPSLSDTAAKVLKKYVNER